jgi:uncharacterized delta-60 repeat protein
MKAGKGAVSIAAAIAAVGLALLALVAVAADRRDASFGSDGVAQPPPPSKTGSVGLGIRDLAAAGAGRLFAAVGDLAGGERGYFAAARISPGGSLDASFGQDGYTARVRVRHGGPAGAGLQLRARAVAIQRDGRVLLAGFQENELGGTAPLLTRFRPNGALDRSFGRGGVVAPKPASEGVDDAHVFRGGGALRDVAVGPGGRIVAVGAQNEERGARPAGLVIAYRRDGSIDRGFGVNGRVVLPRPRDDLFTGFTSVELLGGGKVLVAGYLHGRLSVLRLTAAGELDPAFGGGDGIVMPSAGQPRSCCFAKADLDLVKGGRILLSGIAERAREEPVLLFRLRPDGRPDLAFGTKGKVVGRPNRDELSAFIVSGMARQRNGRIVVVGAAERIDRERTVSYRFTALRYLANGKVDRSFGSGGMDVLEPGWSAADTVVALPNGRVVVGGGAEETEADGGPLRPVLVRYLGR